MKILTAIPCHKQVTSTVDNVSNDTRAVQFSLLQLPLELRRMIYLESILVSRCPTPEQVHERNFRAIWEDLPTPLLSVNRQVRAEVFDILRKGPFTMRVTPYGASFDMLGLSCFIAQQRAESYSGLPGLWIEIWPPHPGRPVEMYNINYYLRELRNELRATSVGISILTVVFRENEIAKGAQDSRPRFELSEPREIYPLRNDIVKVWDHFACVTNVTKAHIDKVVWHAIDVCKTMEGKGALADESDNTLSDLDISPVMGFFLKTATTQRARAKLDAITFYGCYKMSEAEWLAFTEV